MSNEIEVSKSFQEKMYERIRDQIGELLSDEDLKNIIKTAINKTFFEEQKDQYGRITKRPFLEGILTELCTSELKNASSVFLKDYMKENSEKILKVFKDKADETVVEAISNVLNDVFLDSKISMENNFRDFLKRLGIINNY